MISKKFVTHFAILAIIAFSAIQCAKVGSISGGPKDEKPPVLVSSKPPMYALNFTQRKIKIDFDEYIQLKDISQQFNMSPPLKKKPKVWSYNKTIMVEYSDTLKDSTTYTLSFGNSVVDNNEGNIFENFDFVFSTCNYLDSMSVEGFVTDAFTAQPDKESFLVALYNNLSDTAPTTQVPTFTGRTNKLGKFSIKNVKPGTYKLCAFKDKNSNFKYDPVSEAFAFADSIVVLDPFIIAQNFVPFEAAVIDSSLNTDSIAATLDSLKQIAPKPNQYRADLFSFTEMDKKQYIKDNSRKERRKISAVFNRALINDTLALDPVFHNSNEWYLPEFTPRRDSLLIWLTDTNILKSDTLKLGFGYFSTQKADTVWKIDTLNFRFVDETAEKRKKSKDTSQTIEKMKLTIRNTGMQDLHLPLTIETEFPVTEFDPAYVELYQKVDTIEQRRNFKFVRDSLYPRLFHIYHKWESQSGYRFAIYPGCFGNIYNLPHDTLTGKIGTQKEEYYGKYAVNIIGSNGANIIMQLLDKDKVMYENYSNGDGLVTFGFIKPGTYNLKLIFDADNNREFTTGDFYFKRQAEKVLYYKEALNVRSNWDSTIDWNVGN